MPSYAGSERIPCVPSPSVSTSVLERNVNLMEQITFTDFFSQETKRDLISLHLLSTEQRGERGREF